MKQDSKEFIKLLTEAQSSILGYIMTLIPDRARARDLLQETNLTMWKKAADFEEGTNFVAWACRIAYFHVLSFRRKMARDRLVFDDEVLDYLAEREEAIVVQGENDRARALKECLEKLPKHQRELIEERYGPGGSVKTMARVRNRTEGSISQTLYRIRHALQVCVERKITQIQKS